MTNSSPIQRDGAKFLCMQLFELIKCIVKSSFNMSVAIGCFKYFLYLSIISQIYLFSDFLDGIGLLGGVISHFAAYDSPPKVSLIMMHAK